MIGLTQSFLLKDSEVQEELKLKADQVEKANELAAEIVANYERAGRQIRALAAEERKTKRIEIIKPLADEATRKAPGNLDARPVHSIS